MRNSAEAGIAVNVTAGAEVGVGIGVGMVIDTAQALKSIAAKITDMSKIRFITLACPPIVVPLFVLMP